MAAVELSRRERDVLLDAAVMAPSLHNSQPWRLVVAGRQVRVYADVSRQLRAVDPAGRQLVISCGAALLNLRLAAAHLGLNTHVRLVPDPADRTLLATVEIGRPGSSSLRSEPLYEVIALRHTNRLPFEDCVVRPDELSALVAAAQAEGCDLLVVSDQGERHRLGELVRLADIEIDQRPDVTLESAAWTAVEAGRPDGVPGYALGPLAADPDSLIRDLRRGAPVPDRPRTAYENEPVLAILVSPTDDPSSWLTAGQALERVLLTATASGLSVSFLNQPLEIPRFRAEVLPRPSGPGQPQMLLRVGRGLPVPPTPRRTPGTMP
jgi:hypothetical protein